MTREGIEGGGTCACFVCAHVTEDSHNQNCGVCCSPQQDSCMHKAILFVTSHSLTENKIVFGIREAERHHLKQSTTPREQGEPSLVARDDGQRPQDRRLKRDSDDAATIDMWGAKK